MWEPQHVFYRRTAPFCCVLPPSPPPPHSLAGWREFVGTPTATTTTALPTPYGYEDITCFCAATAAHMQQQLRFPTPPITPPRLHSAGSVSAVMPSYGVVAGTTTNTTTMWPAVSQRTSAPPHVRTQSVIMKIGRQSPTAPRRHLLPFKTASVGVEADAENDDDGEEEEEEGLLAAPATDNGVSSTSGSGCGSGSESASPLTAYVCEWRNCRSCFENLDSLAGHVAQLHAVASHPDGLYYCRWQGCQRSERGFNARYKMLVHARTHTKEKPHTCQLCGKSFSRAENLKIHIRSHSGEKPYVCTHAGCGKAYSNSSDRFKHTRTHANEKPYVCKVAGCLKRYTDPSSLRKHVKTFKHGLQLRSSAEGLTTAAALAQGDSMDEDCGSPAYEPSDVLNYGHYELLLPAAASRNHLPEDPRTTRGLAAQPHDTTYWYSPTCERSSPESGLAMEVDLPVGLATPTRKLPIQDEGVVFGGRPTETPLDLRLHRR